MHSSAPRLYVVTPPLAETGDFLPQLEAALSGGDVACLLVRLAARDEGDAKKILRQISELAQPRGAAVLAEFSSLVSANLAVRADCDGVHFPSAAAPELAEALRALQPQRIVGIGGLKLRDDAMNAGELSVDYLMFGEARADGSLPDIEATRERVAWWAEIFNVPCVACAHRLADIPVLAAAGADFVALGAAVWEDARGPAAALREAMQLLQPLPAGVFGA